MKNVRVKPQFPELSTERLILRKMTEKDARMLFQIWSDEEVTKYMNMNSFRNIEQTLYMVDFLNSLFKKKEGIRWGLIRKKDNKLIGTCGFNTWIKRSSRGEIGYELGRKYWGNGYTTEALKEVIRFGFEETLLNRVEAFVVPEAFRSIKVLEKLGFKKEGTLREYGFWNNRYWDEHIYSLLRKDWIPSNKLID
jgi:ribosomal-protein-alanine N-acetyltransferase